MRKKAYYILAVILLGAVSIAFAADAPQAAADAPKIEVVKKEVVGPISGLSKNFIAVEYALDERSAYEIGFKIDKGVEFQRRKLKDLSLGDIVAVVYEQTIETRKGQKPKAIRHKAKTVQFRQPAPKITPEPEEINVPPDEPGASEGELKEQ